MIRKPGPRSLMGQMLLAVAGALLLIQGLGALLVYRAQADRREADMVHAAAFRVIAAVRGEAEQGLPAPRPSPGHPSPALPPDDHAGPPAGGPASPLGGGPSGGGPPAGGPLGGPAQLGVIPLSPGPSDDDDARRLRWTNHHLPPPALSRAAPIAPNEPRDREAEQELRAILAEQDVATSRVVVTTRAVADDPPSLALLHGGSLPIPPGSLTDGEVMVAGVQLGGAQWLVVRVFVRPVARAIVGPLLWQTLLIYAVVVGAMALILRRITRPLAALTRRLDSFAATRSLDGQITPQGPGDVRNLIVAHNAMEGRIAALLDEKDVMLGAIGHDLKTPLAALRVRIESVEDDAERSRMAHTIEDIVRTLDDILSLARVGRPSDPRERTELSALLISVVEEFEDMGAAVDLGDTVRLAASVRATWLRRALRNLIGNALRYGQVARVSLTHEDDGGSGHAMMRVEDDGPGIPDADIGRMMDPFTRGEASRNTATGGAGLGLALATAIADQHGGALTLANRRDADGRMLGLVATLRVPLA